RFARAAASARSRWSTSTRPLAVRPSSPAVGPLTVRPSLPALGPRSRTTVARHKGLATRAGRHGAIADRAAALGPLGPLGSLHRQRDLPLLDVRLEDAHLHPIAGAHHLARIAHEAIRELRDVHETVLVHAEVDEGAEAGHVGDDARTDHARLQVAD